MLYFPIQISEKYSIVLCYVVSEITSSKKVSSIARITSVKSLVVSNIATSREGRVKVPI